MEENYDLHPKVNRDFVDGKGIQAPTESYLKQLHENDAPVKATEPVPKDLHPMEWKDKVNHPLKSAEPVPDEWDLHPQVIILFCIFY